MQAGLQLAFNLLDKEIFNDDKDDKKEITNKNIVMLTDGKPTYGIGRGADRTSTSTICPYGYPMIGDGRNTTHEIHQQVEAISGQIKDKKIGAYAVQVGDESFSCGNSDCNWTKKVAKWLNEDCDFITKQVGEVDDLSAVFDKIANMIKLQAKAWILTDPMGDNIVFKGFGRETDFEGEFKLESDNKTITWNLKNCDPKKVGNEYKYTLSYQIELDTLSKAFNANEFYPTNKKTSLKYLILEENQEIDEKLLKTAYFNIPSVKGYAADLTFTKVDDSDEQKPLAGAKFVLKHDGKQIGDTVVSGDDGKVTFKNIPSGHQYTLEEVDAPKGYVKGAAKTFKVEFGKINDAIQNGEFINETDTVDVNFTKVWDDEGNEKDRPDTITVQLYKYVEAYENPVPCGAPVPLEGQDEVVNVPGGEEEKKPEGGTETGGSTENGDETETGGNIGTDPELEGDPVVEEESSTGDTTDKEQGASLMVLEESESTDGSNEGEGSDVDGGTDDTQQTTKVYKNTWTYPAVWKNLPRYENGKEIQYTVREIKIDDYYATYAKPVMGDDGNWNLTVTNAYRPDSVSYIVTKVWEDDSDRDGVRPSELNLTLYQGIQEYNAPPSIEKDGNRWTYTWSGLPAYDGEGNEYTYTAKEGTVPDGYTAGNDGNEVNGLITNTHAAATTTVTVKKEWDDNNNFDGKRPEKITVNVYGTDKTKAVDTVILNEQNNWMATSNSLPKNENGKAIEYTVKEVAVPNYTASESLTNNNDGTFSYTITNTYTPVSITVNKVWVDDDNSNNTRPGSIIVKLLANGTEVGSVELNEANGWKHTWSALQKYNGNEEIKYTVNEVAVSGYKDPVVTGSVVTGFTIINTYKPDKPVIIPDPEVPGSGPDEPDEPDEPIIDDPDVPLGPGPDEPDEPVIDDPDVPLAPAPTEEADPNEPRTSDDAPLGLMMGMFLVSAGALGAISIRRKKQTEK